MSTNPMLFKSMSKCYHFKYSLLFSAMMLAGETSQLQAASVFDDICELKETSLVECTLPNTQSSVDIESVILPMIQEFDASADYDTPFWISSWGGDGGTSSHKEFDGRGGYGGYGFFSATLYTFVQAFSQTEFDYFIGSAGNGNATSSTDPLSGTGGASSIVALQDDLTDVNDANIEDRLLLITGGGGGSGTGRVSGHQHDGGDGGVVLPIEGVSEYTQGNDGGNGYDDSDNGLGGSSDGPGLGGMGGNSSESRKGFDGIGGLGGSVVYSNNERAQTGWLGNSPLLSDVSDGSGGTGYKTYSGGGGGGGYGGGGAGKGSNNSNGDSTAGYFAGGGGGSFGHGNLITASNQPQAYESHDIDDGEIKITFDLSENFSLDITTNCYKTELNVETDFLVTCEFPTKNKEGNDVHSLDINRLLFDANLVTDVMAEDFFVIDGDTPAWISAYGGSGQGEEIDTSLNYTESSMAGARGYAQTQLTLNDLSGDALYYYIGSQGAGATSDTVNYNGNSSDYINAARGGSATLVTSSELTSNNPLSENNAIVVAGGGGGAGSYSSLATWDDNAYGGSGGGGGIAIASYDVSGNAAGEDGYSSVADYQGKGGNADGQGTGGQGGLMLAEATGESLWGGNGGTLMDYYDGAYGDCSYVEAPGWTNGTPYFTDDSGQGGSGLMGTDVPDMYRCAAIYILDMDLGSAFGAGGGGGYGAGGGSVSYYIDTDTTSSSTDYDYFYSGGAGGAGSYAAPATIADDTYQPTAEDIVPTTGDGEVSITFHVTL